MFVLEMMQFGEKENDHRKSKVQGRMVNNNKKGKYVDKINKHFEERKHKII